ncbi:hypothetical protein P4530_29670 [Bacillus thuringiensis]|uniref:hypothetical protein n=1 Tax=Bacillus thuringiensis TaxID=1428 RepID=UPI000BFC2DB6|nr:hypothetical protein [Bacillus thuringiensis]MED3687087.1 hypothetical protein [Bacillus thuringiensis]PGR88855.1 hypothetical protein COC68_31635 [Bacillus thuringiensis]
MAKIYSNIFLLNDINSLSSLDEVFRRQHRELLSHVKKDVDQVARMCESEKNFIYSWKEIGQLEEMKLPKINGENNSTEEIIFYQKAIANLEYSKKKRKDSFGDFLPKAERVNDLDVESLFFEKGNKVYVLIITSNDYNISRFKTLIGEHNISLTNTEYSLEPDMFNWLFYVYTERDGILNDDTKLENISGFVGNVTDDANVFTGASYQTTELIATKAFISNGGELKKITLRVRDTDVDITCMVNENSTVVISCNASLKLRIMDSMDKATFLLLYLYGYLILRLKQLYKNESDSFIKEDNPKFSKKIGIDVIKSIVEKNNISLKDLESFLVEVSCEQEHS